jgi:predicted O-methyltransferase YrrM
VSNLFIDEGLPATGKKVLLATTAYDATSADYTFAMSRTRQALSDSGIQSAYLLLQGNCHVDDARNAVVREFLLTDCTDLLFLDADVSWEPEDIVKLCQRDLDLVGGVYPYRREGSDTMPMRMLSGANVEDGLIEVEGLPTGFMKIKRRVLEDMSKLVPKYVTKANETALLFDRPAPGPDKVRWGGDIDFCNRFRASGGRIFADVDLHLGHTGTVTVKDSLGAYLRRLSGATLSYIVPRLKAGTETERDYGEAFQYANNNFAAGPDVLALCVGVARKCRGPIIETGSGLSSVLMAAVSDSSVYSLEHVQHYAMRTLSLAEEAGVSNVGMCYAPLKDFWYDFDKFDLPNKFALGFCDGPPRLLGSRMKFFEVIAPRCTAIIVDDFKNDHNFARKVSEWCAANGRTVEVLGRAALLMKEAK